MDYPPVNKHSNGKSPFSIGNASSNGGFSIAMLDYRRVAAHISDVDPEFFTRDCTFNMGPNGKIPKFPSGSSFRP